MIIHLEYNVVSISMIFTVRLLRLIFESLTFRERERLRGVCKTWNRIIVALECDARNITPLSHHLVLRLPETRWWHLPVCQTQVEFNHVISTLVMNTRCHDDIVESLGRWTSGNNYHEVMRIVSRMKKRVQAAYALHVHPLRLARRVHQDLSLTAQDYMKLYLGDLPDLSYEYLDWQSNLGVDLLLWGVPKISRPTMLIYVCMHHGWKINMGEYYELLRKSGSRRHRTLRKLKFKITQQYALKMQESWAYFS